MGFWAAIAAAATAMFMSSYIRCFLGLRFLGNAKVCSTLWEDLGGRDDELGKQIAHLQSNEAWTEMPWICWLGNYCLLSSGRWKWCDWHKAPMLFVFFASQMQYANDFWCYQQHFEWSESNPAAGLYTVKGQQTKLGEPTDVKSIEKMMSTKARHAIHRY